MRYFVELQYNGDKYFGWQIQPNALSVQQKLEETLSILLKEDIKIRGAGRTDTGVHASYYVAHFDAENSFDAGYLIKKWNSFLGSDIQIFSITEVESHAHARFSAISREYHYIVFLRKPVFLKEISHPVYHLTHIDEMLQATNLLFDYEDFTSFSKLHTDVKDNICKIYQAFWTKQGDMLIFSIRANRFLRNMVRAIVGSLLDVGIGKKSVAQFNQIINQRSRAEAGFSVPGNALFLTDVAYPKEIFQSRLSKKELFPFWQEKD